MTTAENVARAALLPDSLPKTDPLCVCGHVYAQHWDLWAGGHIIAHGTRCHACVFCNIYRVPDHECGYEFRPGLGYLANDPDCETCCDLATAKWQQAWSRPLPKGEVA